MWRNYPVLVQLMKKCQNPKFCYKRDTRSFISIPPCCIRQVSYNVAVKSLKRPIVFNPKLYEYPKDNFGLKIIEKYKRIKKTGFNWSIVT